MTIPVARLLADDTRASFCLALLNGRAWTAGELARHAGVSPSTASEHLSALVAGGLLAEERQGRHRYVRLAGPSAAALIESLVAFSPPPAAAPGSLRAHRAERSLAFARTCYDHLAGALGVALADGLVLRGVLDPDGLALTGEGRAWFAGFLGAEPPSRSRRPLARACLDWTERRHHLGGLTGRLLLGHLVREGWLVPLRTGRALRLTPAGREALSGLCAPGVTLTEPGSCERHDT